MSGSTRGEINFQNLGGGKDEKRGKIFFLISLGGTKRGGNWLFIPFLVGEKSMLAAVAHFEEFLIWSEHLVVP